MDKEKAINCIQDLLDVAKFRGTAYIYKRNDTFSEMENVLDYLQNSEPVVHAHWIPLKDLDLCECSRCGRRELHYYGCEASAKPEEAFPYCHCGARMDEQTATVTGDDLDRESDLLEED